MVRQLQQRGHHTSLLRIAPDISVMDNFVDVPPYTHSPHLKLELAGYVTTSLGIVVRRK
jgi:hypothetical protein